MTEASTDYGRLVNSGEYTGRKSPAVKGRMIADAEKTRHRQRRDPVSG